MKKIFLFLILLLSVFLAGCTQCPDCVCPKQINTVVIDFSSQELYTECKTWNQEYTELTRYNGTIDIYNSINEYDYIRDNNRLFIIREFGAHPEREVISAYRRIENRDREYDCHTYNDFHYNVTINGKVYIDSIDVTLGDCNRMPNCDITDMIIRKFR